MTPISRFLEARLPRWLAWTALAGIYAAMLLSLALFDPVGGEAIVYIDLRQ